MISLFKKATEHGAEVVSSVPTSKKAVMCLMEKIQVTDTLPSGINYRTLGRGVSVSRLTAETHLTDYVPTG